MPAGRQLELTHIQAMLSGTGPIVCHKAPLRKAAKGAQTQVRRWRSQVHNSRRRCISSGIHWSVAWTLCCACNAFVITSMYCFGACQIQFFTTSDWALTLAYSLLEEGGESAKIGLVNGASAYRAGGGFLSGGRHAMEESLCAQSTFYLSLDHATQMTQTGFHIPAMGCLASPSVEIFRKGTRRIGSLAEDGVATDLNNSANMVCNNVYVDMCVLLMFFPHQARTLVTSSAMTS